MSRAFLSLVVLFLACGLFAQAEKPTPGKTPATPSGANTATDKDKEPAKKVEVDDFTLNKIVESKFSELKQLFSAKDAKVQGILLLSDSKFIKSWLEFVNLEVATKISHKWFQSFAEKMHIVAAFKVAIEAAEERGQKDKVDAYKPQYEKHLKELLAMLAKPDKLPDDQVRRLKEELNKRRAAAAAAAASAGK